MFCDQCGQRLEPADVFCTQCGAFVAVNTSTSSGSAASVVSDVPRSADEPIHSESALGPEDSLEETAQTFEGPIAPNDETSNDGVATPTEPAAIAGSPSDVSEPSVPSSSCQQCGKVLEPGALFCVQCGARTDGLGGAGVPTSPPPPTTGPSQSTPAFCHQCGSVLETDAAFCNQCGAPSVPVASSRSQRATTASSAFVNRQWVIRIPGQPDIFADTATLQNWARVRRIRSETTIIEVQSGLAYSAGQVPGVFSDKDFTTALLLSIFLGGLGIDRFYLGYTGLGLLKLFTLAGLGVWSLIDMIMIATRNVPDSNGLALS